MERECIDSRQLPDIVDWLLELYTGKTDEERRIILSQARVLWSAVEVKMIAVEDKLTARQAFLIMEEVIVEETRKSQLDYAARAKFAKEDEDIRESRTIINEIITVDEPEPVDPELAMLNTANHFRMGASEHDLIDWELG